MAFKLKNYAWAAAVGAAILAALYKEAWGGGVASGVLSASVQRSVSFPDHSAARFGKGDEQRFARAGTNPLAFDTRSKSRPSVLGK